MTNIAATASSSALLAYTGKAGADAFCRKNGYPFAAQFAEQPFAGAIWPEGTLSADGKKACKGKAKCGAYLYIVCRTAGQPDTCAQDSRGNIGFGNTGEKIFGGVLRGF